jgi:hypothetical protein
MITYMRTGGGVGTTLCLEFDPIRTTNPTRKVTTMHILKELRYQVAIDASGVRGAGQPE